MAKAKINPKLLKLAGYFLRRASDAFCNNGCNDFDFPPDWTDADKDELIKAMNQANNGTDGDGGKYVPDWWAMDFLADTLDPDGK